jgi:membrane protease YdiL (CAAX protease family)
MAPEPNDPVLGSVIIVLGIASVGVWFALADRLKSGPILKYEPRRPVPWHGAWTLLPIALVVLTIAAAIFAGGSADETAARPRETIERIAVGSVQQTALVIAFLAVLIVASGANRTDLGLPNDAVELVRDIRIGIIAWLAALAPVYATQITLLVIFGPAEGHPLLKMVEQQSDPTLFILAFMAAVVVAPICEELLFRLVLQGWLEKWEDKQLGWRLLPALPSSMPELSSADVDGIIPVSEVEPGDPVAAETAPSDPPEFGIAGLPFGWTPILISSLLFALAHFGYGPDPIPLFLLAMILGYVYQRTHRIVPSIVTHALFNGMSLFALWRVMTAGGH